MTYLTNLKCSKKQLNLYNFKMLKNLKLLFCNPKKFFIKFNSFTNYLFKLYILKDKHLSEAKRWFKDNGDETLRLDYELNENSLVFDVGGYKGNFTDKIFNKFKPYIYIFEPHPEFYKNLKSKYKNNPKIRVYNYGLSNKNSRISFGDLDDGSSFYKKSNKTYLCKMKEFHSVFKSFKIEKISLMKINIEGGEFPLMDNIIQNNLLNRVENYQIQFHNFVEDAYSKRNNIIKSLKNTHNLKWCYEFVWESWKIK